MKFYLKFLPVAALAVGVLSCATNASFAGETGTHGGNAPKSDSERIRAAIDRAPQRLLTFITSASKGELPSNVREAFKRFNTPTGREDKYWNAPITRADWNIRKTKFKSVDGPCYDKNHKEKDSSVKKTKTGFEVCMSISRLTRVPPEAVTRTVTALAAHELAHEVGLGEVDAVNVQRYVIAADDGLWGRASVRCLVNELKDYTGKITGYQINFGSGEEDGSGPSAYIVSPDQLGEAIIKMRKSLLGRKVGPDGGCTEFVFIP